MRSASLLSSSSLIAGENGYPHTSTLMDHEEGYERAYKLSGGNMIQQERGLYGAIDWIVLDHAHLVVHAKSPRITGSP